MQCGRHVQKRLPTRGLNHPPHRFLDIVRILRQTIYATEICRQILFAAGCEQYSRSCLSQYSETRWRPDLENCSRTPHHTSLRMVAGYIQNLVCGSRRTSCKLFIANYYRKHYRTVQTCTVISVECVAPAAWEAGRYAESEPHK